MENWKEKIFEEIIFKISKRQQITDPRSSDSPSSVNTRKPHWAHHSQTAETEKKGKS